MSERPDLKDPQETQQTTPLNLHNLYSHVKISVKTLDKIIVGLILVLVIVVVYAISNQGFTVEFDPRGGTPVESQKHLYGEKIDWEVSEREGSRFLGWAVDEDCKVFWDEDQEITGSVRLYACWEE